VAHDATDAVTYLKGQNFIQDIGESFSRLLPIDPLQKIAEDEKPIDKYLTVDLPKRYDKFQQKG